jgi:LysM repeat protein
MQTSTPAPLPTQCPPPEGWLPYLVQPGDTLADLAASNGLSLADLMKANCLISSQLVMSASIYLPPQTATATVTPVKTPTACTKPPGWILYTIKPGDTLSIISRQFQISLQSLMQANCLTDEYIIAGNTLWVPNVSTATPNATPTATQTQIQPPPEPTRTPTPTNTSIVLPTSPTAEPSIIIVPPSATYSPTPSETNTDIPTETSTPTQ